MKFEDVYCIYKLSSANKATAVDVDYVGVLIRCRECKYHRGENACEKDGCYGWYDTDYCSRAERKEE